MNRKGIRAAFTLVELLIVIAILAILSGAAYIGIQRSQARLNNEKVLDDLLAISNAVEQYKKDNGTYPIPTTGADKNVNCFYADTNYAHDCDEADFIQAMVDNALLTKRYLQEVPTDPRTHSRYVYGVTTDGSYFQVAGNYLNKEDAWEARVQGNVEKGYSLSSLIRAFDGPNFVVDGETYLPYSPDHLSISARLDDITGVIKVNGDEVSQPTKVEPGDVIRTEGGASVVIYFSDGSISYLDEESELEILPASEVLENDEDGIITKIKLKLFQGKIWNKVVRLADESEFNIETTSAIAGVRGTEFGIDAADVPKLIVLSGEVRARLKSVNELNQSGPVNFSTVDQNSQAYLDNSKAAAGDGTNFKQFTVPVLNQDMLGGSILDPQNDADAAKILDEYYTIGISNAIKPLILEVDFQDQEKFMIVKGVENVSPYELSRVRFVHVYDVDNNDTLFHSFNVNNYGQVNGNHKFTDVDATLQIPKRIRIQYEDNDGNLSAMGDQVVQLIPQIKLAQAELFNEEVVAVCGNQIIEGGEQCDDGNQEDALDGCNNQCQNTGVLFYASFLDGVNGYPPEYTSAQVDFDNAGDVQLIDGSGLILGQAAGNYLSYTGGPILRTARGTVELIVQAQDLQAQQNSTLYLFDSQINNNPADDEYRITIERKGTNSMELSVVGANLVEVFGPITAADIDSLPNEKVKVVASWNVNAANVEDKATLKVLKLDDTLLAEGFNPLNQTPDMGQATYNAFTIGAQVNATDPWQFPGFIESILIR